jgi:hypothetical protein
MRLPFKRCPQVMVQEVFDPVSGASDCGNQRLCVAAL